MTSQKKFADKIGDVFQKISPAALVSPSKSQNEEKKLEPQPNKSNELSSLSQISQKEKENKDNNKSNSQQQLDTTPKSTPQIQLTPIQKFRNWLPLPSLGDKINIKDFLQNTFSSTPTQKMKTLEQETRSSPLPRLGAFLNYAVSFPLRVKEPLTSLFSTARPEEPSSLRDIEYDSFLVKLKEEKCKGLQDELDRFIDSFVKSIGSISEEQQGLKIHNFITMLMDDFVPLIWEKEKLENISECLEKYIMEHLYTKTFAQTNEHLAKDLALYTRIQSLQFIAPEHLEIPKKFVNEKHWLIAEEDLQNMNSFITPLEKLQCILKSCKEIFDGLRESCGKDKVPGVDDFLPVFIYVILRSNPRNLHSNIQYLTHFRHPSRMLAESGYYFVSFLTAVSFIETLDASALSINPKDFDSLISGNPVEVKTENTSLEEIPKKTTSANLSDANPGIESSDKEDSDWVWLPRKSGKSIYLNEKKLFSHLMAEQLAAADSQKIANENKKEEMRKSISTEKGSDYFLNKNPGDYTVQDITDLLKDYKRLVLLEKELHK